MRCIVVGVLAAVGLVLAGSTLSGQAASHVRGLRCEYLVNPLGIDVEKPRLGWVLSPGGNGSRQSAYRILAASSAATLQQDLGDLWDSGMVASGDSAWVEYAGRPLNSGQQVFWKVRIWDENNRQSAWSAPAKFTMGLLQESDWTAGVIGLASPPGTKEGTPQPFPWLRKSIELEQRPTRATAYVNPLGYYELYVNGRKVDDHVLSPAVSDYSRRTYYVTHDITGYLTAGKNTLALWLGRGWYARGIRGRTLDTHPGVIHDGPLVRAQFEIAVPGGRAVKVATDVTWKVKASPIMPLGRGTAFGDYGGERYDARLEVEGWNSVDFDDSGWASAAVFDQPKAIISAQMVEPNRILETIPAVSVEENPAGEWLIDMGKNLVGWLELKLPASTEAGSDVLIEYADWTPVPGRWATFNQRDEYVTKAGAQTIRSRFNYHGFRYAHVTGLKTRPAVADATGHFIRTAYGRAASFECSNDLLNRIYGMMAWTYENLTLGGSVVDCPTRERLGYGGDAGTSIETGLFLFDTGGLYSRWASNWRDAQAPNGDLPYTAPNYQDQGGGGPMWSGFSVTLPWHVYLTYGDRRVLEVNYPMIQKWLAFAESKTVDHVLEPYNSFGMRMAQWNYLGDWVTPRRAAGGQDLARVPVSARLINNLHYLYTLQLAAKIAGVLGKPQDAELYRRRADTLAQTLHARFWDAARGVYATGEQPYLAFPLLVNVVPADLREQVAKTLEKTIRVTNEGHIDAGMHGTYFLLKYLMEQDRDDLIFLMANQTTFPSWGDMLRQGATTSFESWTGGSHIHDTLISIGAWFIQGLGGIQLDETAPGFKHVIIRPGVVGDLTFARAKLQSVRGEITSDWRIENGSLKLDVTVPPGATATILMPGPSARAVTKTGVRSGAPKGNRTPFEVGSGKYSFTSPWPAQ